MEIIKNITAIIGLVLSAASLISLCTKGGRRFIKWLFFVETKDLDASSAKQHQAIVAIQQQLASIETKLDSSIETQNLLKQSCMQDRRQEIEDIYYQYCNSKMLPDEVHKNLVLSYEIYTQLGGNSHIKDMYEKMKTWEITRS